MAAEKLEALRSRMKELNLDVYLVPSDDPHLSGESLSRLFLWSILASLLRLSHVLLLLT